MNGLRPVLVSSRFWPLVGGAETATASIARGLRDLGWRPQVVTARPDADWSTDVLCRDVPVHRIWQPRYRWGRTRFLIGLARYLRARQQSIDVVCVSQWGAEASTAVKALAGSRVPVVIRAETDDLLVADKQPASHSAARRRWDRRCLEAAAIVATTTARRAQVLALGADPRRVALIPTGVAPLPDRSPERRALARRALAEVNGDLRVPRGQPVALGLGRLDRAHQWDVAIAAWRSVAQRWPFARLWLVGDGPAREDLYRRIRAADLLGRVVLPGTFDSPDELLLAADLLVAPTRSPKESLAVVEAVAAGLPIVVTDGSDYQDLLGSDVAGRCLPGGDVAALSAAIEQHFQDLAAAEARAETIRQRVRPTRTLQGMAVAHAKLFQHVVAATARPAR